MTPATRRVERIRPEDRQHRRGTCADSREDVSQPRTAGRGGEQVGDSPNRKHASGNAHSETHQQRGTREDHAANETGDRRTEPIELDPRKFTGGRKQSTKPG